MSSVPLPAPEGIRDEAGAGAWPAAAMLRQPAQPVHILPERFPLSPGQTERWLAAQLDRNARIALNESACLLLTGAIDLAALEAAIHDVLRRHDSFRMRFDADEPWQFVDPAAQPSLRRIDLRCEDDPHAALDRFCDDAVGHDFVLDQAPMAQFSLLLLSDETTAFHLLYSHLVCDGWSVRTILSELSKAYRARLAGNAAPLRAASSPGQFVTALMTRWNGAVGAVSTAYWREVMRRPPEPLRLGDLAMPAVRSFGAGTVVAEVGAATLSALQLTAQQHDATLFPVILAAMAVALQRRTGRDDFVIAIPMASQALVRGPTVVADGAIDLPLRLSCRADVRFDEMLAQARDRVAEALKHPYVTQAAVARDVGVRSMGNRAPLTGILCNMIPRLNARSFEPLEARAHEGIKARLLGELLFNFLLDADALTITLHYSADYFSRQRAQELVADLQAVFQQVADAVGSGGAEAPPAEPTSAEMQVPASGVAPTVAALEFLLDRWAARLLPVPPALDLPTDLRRPAVLSGRTGVHMLTMPAAELEGLHALAGRLGVAPAAALLSVFVALLHRLTAQADMVLGLAASGDGGPGRQTASGGARALRLNLDPQSTVSEWMLRAHQSVADAFAQEAVPFDRLVQRLGLEPDAGRAPLHQVSFAFDDRPGPEVEGPSPVVAATQDLALHCRLDTDGLRCRFTFNADVVTETGVALIARRLRSLVGLMAGRPDDRVAVLDVRAPDEATTLGHWNATAMPFDSTRRVHDLVDAQAVRAPHRVALVGADLSGMSYADLAVRSNRLVRLLRQRGVQRGTLVGICVERNPAMVVAQLAVWKAGAGYVPLDPDYPPARLAFMANDARLALLLTDTQSRSAMDWPADRTIDLDAGASLIGSQDASPLEAFPALDATADDVAYVIYTSGSTGQPKGVSVPHRAVVNFLQSMAREPGLGADDRLLAVTTLSFDIAVLELLLPLTVGARVVVADRRQVQDGAQLHSLLQACAVTSMQATPGTWRMLLDAGWSGGPGFKALVGGEPLPPDLAATLTGHGVELWNMYGPTETTVWSTCSRITPPPGRISIGTPIANTQVHVLDADGRPCPIGVAGELTVGGAGVALGYLGRAELTAERFVADPFSGGSGRMYRTGDSGRWRTDGCLEHLGRLDSQIKLRGHRIELGEVEARLAVHPGVSRCVVLVREDAPGDQRLVAHVVPRAAMPSASALRDHLAASLPKYMLPQHIVRIAALPLLPNGKVDRASLPVPGARSADATTVEDGVRTATQQAVWDIWRDVLGVEGLGLHDNFFDLGGHSLLAMSLVSRLKKRLDVALTLNSILQAPTVALLAALIDGGGTDHDSLMTLRAGGADRPVFLVHDASGETLIYRSLALRLAPDMPVYALRPHSVDGLPMVHTRIEDMAAHYVARVRTVQPEGPYRLGGLCSGGLIAFEMALQLQRAGQQVGLLALIDTGEATARPVHGRFAIRQLGGWAREFGGRASVPHPAATGRAVLGLAHVLGRLGVEQLRTRFGWVWSFVEARRLRAFLDQGKKPPPRLRKLTPPQIHLLAQSGYRNRDSFRGDVVLFRATRGNGDPGDEPFIDVFGDPRFGWQRSIAGNIECIDVPGGHFSMLAEPNVDALAAALQARLGRSTTPRASG